MKAAVLRSAHSAPVHADFEEPVASRGWSAPPRRARRPRPSPVTGTPMPAYIQLIAEGSVDVPYRAFPLSDVSRAWAASADSGPRVVLVPG